jgi:hypothetical protein
VTIETAQLDDRASTIHLPVERFEDYLSQEFPSHLAAWVGEDLEEWHATNQRLLQAAEAGDDDALFELLGRDPRHLTSELVMRRVITWRTQIAIHDQHYRFRASRFWTSPNEAAGAKRRMEQARNNLLRLGQCQLATHDRRGKRPLPHAGHVRGIYYGVLCLLQGLRVMDRDWTKQQVSQTSRRHLLAEFLRGLSTLNGGSPFLSYVVQGAQLLIDPEVLARAERAYDDLTVLVNGKDMPPSDTAVAVTAVVFEVSEDTVERLRAQRTPILLSSSPKALRFLVGDPSFALLEFPEVQALRATLTR